MMNFKRCIPALAPAMVALALVGCQQPAPAPVATPAPQTSTSEHTTTTTETKETTPPEVNPDGTMKAPATESTKTEQKTTVVKKKE